MTHLSPSSEKGFTLVELAISLMIIGLLIGGVLKGQELIENARITAVARQFKSYEAAMNSFRSAYGYMPGDIVRTERIPGCTAAPCSTNGNGDNVISGYWNNFGVYGTWDFQLPQYIESRNFWLHMLKAGFISGVNATGTASTPFQWGYEFPAGPINETGYLVQGINFSSPYPSNLIPATIAYLSGTSSQSYGPFTAAQAAALDLKMDDGKPFSGDIVTPQLYPNPCVSATDATGLYLESNPNTFCVPVMLLK